MQQISGSFQNALIQKPETRSKLAGITYSYLTAYLIQDTHDRDALLQWHDR